MSQLLKFRFRWFERGGTREVVIDAPDYPRACYRLALHQAANWPRGQVPDDFTLDLSKPERVE